MGFSGGNLLLSRNHWSLFLFLWVNVIVNFLL